MVNHTGTVRRLLPTNCLSVFDHFVGLALKGVTYLVIVKHIFHQNQPFATSHLTHFQASVGFYIETSHLLCRAKQMTGFYMKCNTRLKLVN